jgi:uncharacterized protein YecE (DUF72 family)
MPQGRSESRGSKMRSRTSGATDKLLIGPAGWAYPDWSGIVYPVRRSRDFHQATYLAQYFDTIEINTSFYQPLRPPIAEQWVERVAGNPRFLFTAKLWKKFTHEGNVTSEDERAVREGFAPLTAANRLGAVLMQFSQSFHRTPENLGRLQELIIRFQDYPLVVEMRHSSWDDPEMYALVREHKVGFCNIDQPLIGRSLRPGHIATSPIGYIRLHGRRYDTWFSDDPMIPRHERYNYLYNEEELAPWATRAERLMRSTDVTFVITNNHFQGKSVVNALQLIHLITGAKVRVPETLRHHYPQLETIADAPAAEPTLFPMPPR